MTARTRARSKFAIMAATGLCALLSLSGCGGSPGAMGKVPFADDPEVVAMQKEIEEGRRPQVELRLLLGRKRREASQAPFRAAEPPKKTKRDGGRSR